jgi:hypothetical protein
LHFFRRKTKKHFHIEIIIDIGSEDNEMINIVEQLVLSKPLESGNGYTWTLSSMLGLMLRHAEAKFGPRDQSYTILGIEFINGIPQVWYPGNCKHIVIQIGKECLVEPDRACFQLAHETIHLLSPTGTANANVLEDGIAAYFQVWFMQNHYPANWQRSGVDWSTFERRSYIEAKEAVERLFALDVDAVKKLRAVEPNISRITSKMIRQLYPSLPRETSDFLGSKFVR